MPVDTSSKEYLDFKQLKANASVRAILASLGLLDALERRDNELVGQCMLGDKKHGKSDSFSFNVEKKTFQCFSCKRKGSILDFCAKHLGAGATLREGAQYVRDTMHQAHVLAGEGASEAMLVAAIADETDGARANEPRIVSEQKAQVAEQEQSVNTLSLDKPLKPADMQNAVMSWSLAEYRVKDGKLNPDDLVVVDTSTLEFMRQLCMPENKMRESRAQYFHNLDTNALCDVLSLRLMQSFKRGAKIKNPRHVESYFMAKLAGQQREVFAVLFLDNKNQAVHYQPMFYGTIDQVSVYPREVVRSALEHHASAVVLAHNHPSGVPEPSSTDIKITKRLKDALALVDIRLLDHIVIGGGEAVSLAEKGMI